METRLEHARANVADLQRAIEWYTTVLGFEVESVWPPDDPNYAHFKAAGGATFAVMEADGRGGRFNFTVDDPDPLWEQLKDRVTVIEPLFDTAYGTRKFTVADPDGNELGFVRGGDDLVSRVEHALRSSREVRDVQHVGSRARGDPTALSDWDFRIAVTDFPTVAAELPELVRPLSPLAAQWDRLSEEQCYMLMLHGPHKVDLIFDEPHVDEPPWHVTPETLQPIDAHFWDWILWLAAKDLAGKDDLVAAELSKMTAHLLAPMGVSRAPGNVGEAIDVYLAARSSLEAELDVHVSRAVEREVRPAITSR